MNAKLFQKGIAAGCLLSSLVAQAVWAAVLPPGRVVAWGNNDSGQTNVPAGLTDVVVVAAGGINGSGHSLALKVDGTVVAWGRDDAGQADVPAGLSNVVAIAAGATHSLALTSDGTIVGWGENGLCQATAPPGLSNVVAIAIATHHYHDLALKADGTVAAWGFNHTGQSNVPDGLSNVVAIAAGDVQSVALLNKGTLVAWGQAPLPGGLSNVVAIAAGGYGDFLCRNLVLRADGTVVAWGVFDNYSPPGLSNVVAVAVGERHSMALHPDGTVVSWGNLGDPSADVPGAGAVRKAIAIAAGSGHSLAIVQALKITSLGFTNNLPVIGFRTYTNRAYSVQWTRDLSAGVWTNLPGSEVVGTGATAFVVDTNSAVGIKSRFYRVVER